MCHTIIFIIISVTVMLTDGCVRRRSQENGVDDGHYCVCNASYCDQVPYVLKSGNAAKYTLITSSKSGLRFHVSNGKFENFDMKFEKKKRLLPKKLLIHNYWERFRRLFKKFSENSFIENEEHLHSTSEKITVNRSDVYQEIFGFGGAVTDAAAMNILNLTSEASDKLLGCYFGPHGIDYTFIRTPMGGCDFSTRPYTYAMVENDTLLEHFKLQEEDYVYKIPIIQRAQQLRNNTIKLITAPWSASPWMKTNNSWTSESKLRPEYRQLWAEYFVKYLQAYRSAGLEFWSLSPQNEPLNYLYAHGVWINAMRWTAEEERDWIIEHLWPTLKRENFGNIKIFSIDENRIALPEWPNTILQDKRARDIISGIALHFYFDNEYSVNLLDDVKRLFPEKHLIYTEACVGISPEKNVILGSWGRAERYAKNIIDNMLHWVSSWNDWNIALNLNGGPNWVNNYVDSSIIVNSTANEFYKQPMFYAIGHFSKYVPAGSMRIGTTSENIEGIKNIAFSTPDDGIVLVILNLNEEEKQILIEDLEKGITKIKVPGNSINTMKYW